MNGPSQESIPTIVIGGGLNVVIETSANLRSCRNIEQFTICDDAGLLAFHRSWIDQVIQESGQCDGEQN